MFLAPLFKLYILRNLFIVQGYGHMHVTLTIETIFGLLIYYNKAFNIFNFVMHFLNSMEDTQS